MEMYGELKVFFLGKLENESVKVYPIPAGISEPVIKFDEKNNAWLFCNMGPFSQGLMKFDSTYWKTFTVANSDIPYNKINFIDFDMNGNVWLAIE